MLFFFFLKQALASFIKEKLYMIKLYVIKCIFYKAPLQVGDGLQQWRG